MGTGRKERPQQAVGCSAGNETGRLELEESRESENFLPASLTSVACRFPGSADGSWWLGKERDGVGREDCSRRRSAWPPWNGSRES